MSALRIKSPAGLWRFSIRTRVGFLDAEARNFKADAEDLGVTGIERVAIARVYYCLGKLSADEIERLKAELLADPITEECEATVIASPEGAKQSPEVASSALAGPPRNDEEGAYTVEVAYHPGVRDPVEDSLKKGAIDLGVTGIEKVHTAKAYTFFGRMDSAQMQRITEKLLVNATIQQVVTPENLRRLLSPPEGVTIPIETVHLVSASDTVLQRVSIDHQLSLNLEEMRAIQAAFRKEGREPTLLELETLAQTWSEHCKHKTLRGPIVYTEEIGGVTSKRMIQNLLKSTIMKVTDDLAKPWCVSVFVDNSGVIQFDEETCVCFKVETHNHPSALEPFGGAATGIGGVIRDILGTGRGAKPVASTDIFCFAPPDLPSEKVPPGMLSPRRIIKGVVAGVKDYGNKMGIPTVNGAVLFDERFVGNPLVYCGNVGLIPRGLVTKQVAPAMKIVLVGGRTGRDGIHGATFSSLTLTQESETVSSTAVQIGDPITEKKVAEALLTARDQDLFSAVTDCGAGGLSSAVGEMGASCGAKVDLEKVPLKVHGMTPLEIWISESQERMVLSVLPEKVELLLRIFSQHDVEAAVIGEFTNSRRLELFFEKRPVGNLSMEFLHQGLPEVARPARWSAEAPGAASASGSQSAPSAKEPDLPPPADLTQAVLNLLKSWDTCSKEWIVRQYDHEVQGGSVIKPLVEGERCVGPSDAAIVRPRLDSSRAVALANGINFHYGDLDPYWMAALAVDEAVRQIVAVGGTLDPLALLDNFCWGDPTNPQVLGTLVRAALGCSDAAKAFGTPFISGKDSLHNEYRVGDRTIQIPGTLLISAIGVIPDAGKAISMDAKKAGNSLVLVGLTKPEMGGSSYYRSRGELGASVPKVDFTTAPALLAAVSRAIAQGLAVSGHDCSEGGLAVAAAEMAFAGGLGLALDLKGVPVAPSAGRDDWVLFSESPTRILLEVPAEMEEVLRKALAGFPVGKVGRFVQEPIFRVTGLSGKTVVEVPLEQLQKSWEEPFRGW